MKYFQLLGNSFHEGGGLASSQNGLWEGHRPLPERLFEQDKYKVTGTA